MKLSRVANRQYRKIACIQSLGSVRKPPLLIDREMCGARAEKATAKRNPIGADYLFAGGKDEHVLLRRIVYVTPFGGFVSTGGKTTKTMRTLCGLFPHRLRDICNHVRTMPYHPEAEWHLDQTHSGPRMEIRLPARGRQSHVVTHHSYYDINVKLRLLTQGRQDPA